MKYGCGAAWCLWQLICSDLFLPSHSWAKLSALSIIHNPKWKCNTARLVVGNLLVYVFEKNAKFTIWFLCAREKIINYRNLMEQSTLSFISLPLGSGTKNQQRRLCSERGVCIQLQWEMASLAHGTSSETLLRSWLACHMRQPTALC